jgi:cysteinyl-tRNA synthetase
MIKKYGGDILGILPEGKSEASDLDLAPVVDLLIEIRNEMKAEKNFKVADSIRDRLKESGILIEDTREGTRWRKV